MKTRGKQLWVTLGATRLVVSKIYAWQVIVSAVQKHGEPTAMVTRVWMGPGADDFWDTDGDHSKLIERHMRSQS